MLYIYILKLIQIFELIDLVNLQIDQQFIKEDDLRLRGVKSFNKLTSDTNQIFNKILYLKLLKVVDNILFIIIDKYLILNEYTFYFFVWLWIFAKILYKIAKIFDQDE